MKYILEIILIAGFFFLGYHFGRQSVNVVTTEVRRVDTVFYPKPEPARVLPPTFASVKVPRMLFAPRDTVYKTVIADGTDSIEIPVTVEHKEYGDSTYRAQVSGPRVGTLGPSLDWIETYNRTTIQQQTNTRRSRFALTAGVGAAYTPQGFQPYIGAGVGIILWQW
jgi:hypothetical protein